MKSKSRLSLLESASSGLSALRPGLCRSAAPPAPPRGVSESDPLSSTLLRACFTIGVARTSIAALCSNS